MQSTRTILLSLVDVVGEFARIGSDLNYNPFLGYSSPPRDLFFDDSTDLIFTSSFERSPWNLCVHFVESDFSGTVQRLDGRKGYLQNNLSRNFPISIREIYWHDITEVAEGSLYNFLSSKKISS